VPASQEAAARAYDPAQGPLLSMLDPKEFPSEFIPSSGRLNGEVCIFLTFRTPGTTLTIPITVANARTWRDELNGIIDTVSGDGRLIKGNAAQTGGTVGGLIRNPYAQ
jgi:hypothetical protein